MKEKENSFVNIKTCLLIFVLCWIAPILVWAATQAVTKESTDNKTTGDMVIETNRYIKFIGTNSARGNGYGLTNLNAMNLVSNSNANVIWVDPVYGSDSAGEVGKITKPFLTLAAAETAATASTSSAVGDTIVAMPGAWPTFYPTKMGVKVVYLDKKPETIGTENLRHAWVSIQSGTGPFKIGCLGDSVATYKYDPIVNSLRGFYGRNGGAFAGGSQLNDVTTPTSLTVTNLGLWYQDLKPCAPGTNIEFYSSAVTNILADTFEVYYSKNPGTNGTFKIQTSLDGGAWSDQSGLDNVSSSAVTAETGYATFTKTQGRYKLRVLGLTGTNLVINASAFLSTSPGVRTTYLDRGGSDFQTMAALSTNIWGPVLTNLNLNLLLIEAKDSPTIVSQYLPVMATNFLTFAPNMDVVCIGTYPISTNDDVDSVQQNRVMKDICMKYGWMYFDGYTAYRNWATITGLSWNADGTHLVTVGKEYVASQLLRDLGLINSVKWNAGTMTNKPVFSDYTFYKDVGDFNLNLKSQRANTRSIQATKDSDGTETHAIRFYGTNHATYPSGIGFFYNFNNHLNLASSGSTRFGDGDSTAPTAFMDIVGNNSEQTTFKVTAPSGQTAPILNVNVNGTDKMVMTASGIITNMANVIITNAYLHVMGPAGKVNFNDQTTTGANDIWAIYRDSGLLNFYDQAAPGVGWSMKNNSGTYELFPTTSGGRIGTTTLRVAVNGTAADFNGAATFGNNITITNGYLHVNGTQAKVNYQDQTTAGANNLWAIFRDVGMLNFYDQAAPGIIFKMHNNFGTYKFWGTNPENQLGSTSNRWDTYITKASLTNYLDIVEAPDAATPSANTIRLYAHDISSRTTLKFKDDGGKTNIVQTANFHQFASNGDALIRTHVLATATTDATETEMSTTGAAPGSGLRVLVPSGSTISCVLNICARKDDGTSKQMLRQFVIKNTGGTTALAGTPIALGTDTGDAGATTWSVAITADDTNDSIAVKVTGVAATNIRWLGRLETTEVNY